MLGLSHLISAVSQSLIFAAVSSTTGGGDPDLGTDPVNCEEDTTYYENLMMSFGEKLEPGTKIKCAEVKVKDNYCDGRGTKPIKKETAYCILWGEISLFQSEIPQPDPNNPDNPVNPCSTDPEYPVDPKWQEMCRMHAISVVCRDWKYPPGLKPGQIECKCPPNMKVEPEGKSADRNWQRIKACADSVWGEFQGKTNAEKEAYCKGNYHFYHYKPGTPLPANENDYMTPEILECLRRKERERQLQNPPQGPQRIFPIRKMPKSSCEEIEILFPPVGECFEDRRYTRPKAEVLKISIDSGTFESADEIFESIDLMNYE